MDANGRLEVVPTPAGFVVDVSNRWVRQLGQIDVARYLGAAMGPANPVDVQDTGLNTNPRRYEKDNDIHSPVVAVVGPAATPLWTVATVPARTAGLNTTIYTIEIENSTGAPITAWLEIGGVAITVPFHVADDDSIIIPYKAGFGIGNNDVDCNATAAGVNFSIKGTEA